MTENLMDYKLVPNLRLHSGSMMDGYWAGGL